jgi:hypothetical protein
LKASLNANKYNLRARVIARKRSKEKSGTSAASSPKDKEQDFHHDRRLIFRAISVWDSEYIPLACPLVSCTLIGPFAVNVCAALAHDRSTVYIDMLKLVLERIGQYWDIGSAALSVFPSFHLRSKSHPTSGTVTTNTFCSL